MAKTGSSTDIAKPEKPWHLRPWYQRHKGKLVAAGIVLGIVGVALAIGLTGGLAAPVIAAGASVGVAIGVTMTGVSATAALASVASTAGLAIMTGGVGYDIKRRKEVGRALEPKIKTRKENLAKNIKSIKKETAEKIREIKSDTSKSKQEISEKIKIIEQERKKKINSAKNETKAAIKNLRDEEAKIYAERLENYNRQQAEKKVPVVHPEEKKSPTPWKKSDIPQTLTNISISSVARTENIAQSADEMPKVRSRSVSLSGVSSEPKKVERRPRAASHGFEFYKTHNAGTLQDLTHTHDSAKHPETEKKKTEHKSGL